MARDCRQSVPWPNWNGPCGPCQSRFQKNSRALLADIKSNFFGNMQDMMYVIEYQGRGVMHAHIIKYDGQSPEERGKMDDTIWTNLPEVLLTTDSYDKRS